MKKVVYLFLITITLRNSDINCIQTTLERYPTETGVGETLRKQAQTQFEDLKAKLSTEKVDAEAGEQIRISMWMMDLDAQKTRIKETKRQQDEAERQLKLFQDQMKRQKRTSSEYLRALQSAADWQARVTQYAFFLKDLMNELCRMCKIEVEARKKFVEKCNTRIAQERLRQAYEELERQSDDSVRVAIIAKSEGFKEEKLDKELSKREKKLGNVSPKAEEAENGTKAINLIPVPGRSEEIVVTREILSEKSDRISRWVKKNKSISTVKAQKMPVTSSDFYKKFGRRISSQHKRIQSWLDYIGCASNTYISRWRTLGKFLEKYEGLTEDEASITCEDDNVEALFKCLKYKKFFNREELYAKVQTALKRFDYDAIIELIENKANNLNDLGVILCAAIETLYTAPSVVRLPKSIVMQLYSAMWKHLKDL